MNKNIAHMALEIIKWKYSDKKFPGEQTIVNEVGDTIMLILRNKLRMEILQNKTKELELEDWFQDTVSVTPPKTKKNSKKW